jgi:DNA primase
VRRIDEQLRLLTRQAGSSGELDEDARRLLTERGELLALKKRVLEETVPSVAGTKKLAEPV